MKLPRLTNSQYDSVARLAELSGIPITQCPTCRSRPINAGTDLFGWVNGTYRYRGQVLDCDCETQMNLRKHYLLAGIGEEFQRLDWTDFDGDPKVVERVQFYLDHWPSARANGMGVEFSSPNLGVGKTFGATHIGKELIKRNEYVFFIPFHEVIGVLTRQNPNWQEIYDRLRTTTLVILDEVRPPHYEGQKHLFADMFEETIRHRSSYNLPTIITTNLTAGELERHYPRPYSLLRAKQLRIEMTGQDVRQGKIENENIELIFNDEVRPIQ